LQESKREKIQFWRSLPPSSAAKLSFAVFFTFAALGFVGDLFHPQGGSFYLVLVWSVYSGLAAVGFFFARRHPKWLLWGLPLPL
jgi:hypothetical protein